MLLGKEPLKIEDTPFDVIHSMRSAFSIRNFQRIKSYLAFNVTTTTTATTATASDHANFLMDGIGKRMLEREVGTNV
jgi:hypothetical protein